MSELIREKATICVVNYKTLGLTRLCLRSIRKYTKYPYELVVVDNNSADASLEYLRSLSWIRLLERTYPPEERGGYAHAAGLDLGLASCHTEFFVSMHSDALVKRKGWLADLIGYFANNEEVACVGSGKIELLSRWRVLLKQATDLRTFRRKLVREPDRLGVHRYYNRTICCVYRTAVLRREGLSFGMYQDRGLTGGKKLYFELVDRGYRTVELAPSVMSRYIVHLAHATQAVNPDEFSLRRRTVRKYNRLASRVMSSQLVQELVSDVSLDQ
jgi:glycosyltransferase involved in cell wall biosynthesis